MDGQLDLFANKSSEDFIRSVISEEFLQDIECIQIQPLKNPYSDNVWHQEECSNVQIQLKISMYYPQKVSGTLCKLIDSNLYFPNLGADGVFPIGQDSIPLHDAINSRLKTMFPSETFGCCHRFKECSRSKKCLHKNAFYAQSCMYKKNLDAGKIFY